jgi:NTP pyrophosphatase (non-canonical NTP hydrolase)
MLCFDTLRQANKARQKEWDPDSKITMEFRAIEFGGEAGEVLGALLDLMDEMARTIRLGSLSGAALNLSKKLARQRMGLRGSTTSIDALAMELADIVLTVDLFAEDAGIDLGEAVRTKFNKVSRDRGLHVFIPDGDIDLTEYLWPKNQPQNGNLLAKIKWLWQTRNRQPRKTPVARWDQGGTLPPINRPDLKPDWAVDHEPKVWSEEMGNRKT